MTVISIQSQVAFGHVGNSGSSTEPHLHMHIVDQQSFLAGNGLPSSQPSMPAGRSRPT